MNRAWSCVLSICLLPACGAEDPSPPPELGAAGAAGAASGGAAGSAGALAGGAGGGSAGASTSFAGEVVSFTAGDGAGYGQDAMPEVVLGRPNGGGSDQGSLDVLSLGKGGEIVLGFGADDLVDGDGPDFIVFENPFWAGGDEHAPYKELGEVSVSEDGVTWRAFPCAPESYMTSTCAGWRVVWATRSTPLPYDPAKTGGDPFDLRDLGVTRARYVKIRDLSAAGASPNAGFDLDAVAVLHSQRAR